MSDELKLAQSLVDWWQLAGVEWDYTESPNDWLADDPAPQTRSVAPLISQSPVSSPPRPAAVAAQPKPAPAITVALPDDLTAFQQAWSEGALGPDGGDGGCLAPHGVVGAKVMVITAAPERDDETTVLSGKAGKLIGNIAAAAGFAPETLYRASYFPRVVLDGRAAAEHVDAWRRIALHHIALVQPELLVVAGGDTARALLGHDPSQKPPVLHFLNHGGGTVKTVVMRKPSLMFHRIAQEKAMAWQSWQLLLVE
ncbi:uracil DNA glycosylase superfamily protein [Blastomonas sp. RAC04]|uniref:uracil-DNA glycosylase family protein n=1 Tax=Blastomonas sp. RAC04 TaxID=1842535 RepID=UPI00083DA105|nr:uracil-DNA glycosylase family protein [Blastomonas sp. RAC04]AOG02153.1 uracil DNA glycosylase superfamily protein [Blastomonas sp. RAC04]